MTPRLPKRAHGRVRLPLPAITATGYINDGNTDKANKTATFNADLPAAGLSSAGRWTTGANRATNVPYVITSPRASSPFLRPAEQQRRLVSLAPITSLPAPAACADQSPRHERLRHRRAVEFVSGDDITVDNSATTVTGSWTTGTSSTDRIGANYLSDGNTAKGAKSVTFTPSIAPPARMRSTVGGNRAAAGRRTCRTTFCTRNDQHC